MTLYQLRIYIYVRSFLLQSAQRTALSHPMNANQLYSIIHGGPMRQNDCFLGTFGLKKREMALYLLHKHLMQRYVHLGFLLVMGLSILGDCQETSE